MRILFVTSTRVGDAVLSTCVLRTLLRQHPGARVTVACGPAAASLFEGVPGLTRIIPMAKKSGGRHWLDLWLRTAPIRWDLVVDLRGSALACVLWAKRRRIYRTAKSYVHRVESLGRFIGGVAAPKIWLTPKAEGAADALMPAGGRPCLALGPTANWTGKQWPVERFIALTERLTAAGAPFAGAPVLVLGGPGERAAAEPLLHSLPAERVIDLVGKVDLLAAAACLKRAGLYVGNDSGLMHLAAAAGVPTIGLFGPSREAHYAPYGPLSATVRGESYEKILASVLRDRARNPKAGLSYMGSISVDAVWDAVQSLLARVPAPSGAGLHVPA